MMRASFYQFFGIFVFSVFLLCAVCFSSHAKAQEKAHYPIGEIAALEGSSYFKRSDGIKKRIKVGDQIYLNTVIGTDKDSKVMIVFIDDTQITLAEETELVIDEYIFDPYDSDENEGKFLITGEGFRWVSGLLSKAERPKVKIKTQAGSIGIRGTDFWAGRVDEGYGVVVEDGLVSFEGDWGEQDVPSGQGAFIDKYGEGVDEVPGETKPWQIERKRRAFKKTTFVRNKRLHERLKDIMRSNIKKRHDYRSRVFPYKNSPYNNRRKSADEFFTDEFLDMKDNLGREDYNK